MAPRKPRRGSHASISDFKAAITSLSDVDAIRVRNAANYWAASLRRLGLGKSGDDLLQEAITLAVEDTRHWPKGLELVVFLDQTMRSLASHERRDMGDAEIVDESEVDLDGRTDRIRHQTRNPDSERVTAARQQLEQIKKAFAKDEKVLQVIEGLRLEKKGPQIQKEMAITGTEFETIMTRLRRRIDRDEGWEP